MNTSSTRPPKEIGFLKDEETVNSWVLVQKSALPKVLISVSRECRSSRNASAAQIRSTPTVATTITVS